MALASLVFVLFTSILYWENAFGLSHWVTAVPEKVLRDREFWRLITALFVHSDANHLLGNAISLVPLSYLLYGYFGSTAFPGAAVCLGAIANLFSLMTYAAHTQLLGVSGAIYAMAGMWLALYFFIDRRFGIWTRLMRALGFALVLLVPSSVSPEVSYRTHAIGFLLGLLFGCGYFIVRKTSLRSFETFEREADDGSTLSGTLH